MQDIPNYFDRGSDHREFAISATVFEEFQTRLQALRRFAREHGLPFDASRMGTYRRIFERFHESRKAGGELITGRELKCIHQALDELQELETIITELGSPDVLAMWRHKFDVLFSGHVFPEGDKAGTPARDMQFELYFPAWCRRAAFITRCDEPDVIIQDGDVELAAAIKRVKSEKKLLRRIREADEQICHSTKQGVVVVDISHLVNPNNRGFATEHVDRLIAEFQKMVDDYIEERFDQLRANVDSRHTMAIVAYSKLMFLSLANIQMGSIRYLRVAEFAQPKENSALRHLVQRLLQTA